MRPGAVLRVSAVPGVEIKNTFRIFLRGAREGTPSFVAGINSCYDATLLKHDQPINVI